LRFEEREIISRELSRGSRPRYIARVLGRHHSTVYDEIGRNGGAENYGAIYLQSQVDVNRARPKGRKLEESSRLHDAVNDGLRQKWSLGQIGRRLREEHPVDQEMRVSHEAIYECLYAALGSTGGNFRAAVSMSVDAGVVAMVAALAVAAMDWWRGRARTGIPSCPPEVAHRPAHAAHP
jgi:IS30 family transposase